MQALRHLVLAAALVALALLLASGPATRLGLWDWRMGLTLLRWAFYVGAAVAAVALALLVIPRTRGMRPSRLALALVLALVAAGPGVALQARARSVPPIHDITTDVREPPAFVALAAQRRASPNGLDYGGAEIAAAQQKAYPDIQSRIAADPPAKAFERALEAARTMGWEIVASDASAGRIEATATTAWFGFKDDVVVRVRPEGAGSRIDVRSVSRVGRSDVGANAARIRAYLERLA